MEVMFSIFLTIFFSLLFIKKGTFKAHQGKTICVFIYFFWIYTYRFVTSVVTVIPLIPYYYQLYKIPNKTQTDFQNLPEKSPEIHILYL